MKKILSYADLKARGIPLSRSQIRRLEKLGKFPRRIHLSARCIGWGEDEIEDHITQCAESRPAVVAQCADSRPAKSIGTIGIEKIQNRHGAEIRAD